MKKYIYLFLFFSFNSFPAAEENVNQFVNPNYAIDWKYVAGEFLIYDCTRGHYACVNFESNLNCIQERNYAIERKMKKYPCAALAKFSNKKLCVEKNYKIVDINAPRRFCYPK